MTITIHLPAVLARLAEGQTVLPANGATLGHAVADVAARFPQLGPRLRDADGSAYRFVTFYVNDEDARFHGGFDAALRDGDEVVVVPALAGG